MRGEGVRISTEGNGIDSEALISGLLAVILIDGATGAGSVIRNAASGAPSGDNDALLR